jgi:riboflavin biosynthesis pyrimidine reductase
VSGETWRIEPLFAAAGPTGRRRGGSLPRDLATRYGADFAIALRDDRPTIVSNFVSTIDGVVAFDTHGATGGREVSGGSEPDRFLMGLLRATSDAVMLGAGTVRSGQHRWTPASVHPASAEAYARWRRSLGLAPQPTAVIVTGSGEVDPAHPGLRDTQTPAIIVTTEAGARQADRLGLPDHVEVVALGASEHVDLARLPDLFRDRGFELIDCEGGPKLLAGLLEKRLIDEMFLTVAPQVAGRSDAVARLSLVDGVAFAVADAPWTRLVSAMHADSHLFLRYRLDNDKGETP